MPLNEKNVSLLMDTLKENNLLYVYKNKDNDKIMNLEHIVV